MIDEGTISETLHALSDRRLAITRGREIKPIRGVLGVPDGEIARIAAAAYDEDGIHLDADMGALQRLFSSSFEDGIVAIALTAAGLPDAPEAALELGLQWLGQVDDPMTADALGWMVLGPAALSCGRPVAGLLHRARELGHPAARRAVVAAGLALTPEPLQGPAAAALRQRVGERHLRLVDEAFDDALAELMTPAVRDDAPTVRKAARRVLRAWVKASPAAVVAWADGVKGGLPKLLGEEVKRARSRARRLS